LLPKTATEIERCFCLWRNEKEGDACSLRQVVCSRTTCNWISRL